MDTPLSKLLKEIGKEYGCDDEYIQPIITKLNNEFYFKLKDMKNLSFDLWKSFNLPINLFYVLNDKYQSLVSQPQSSSVAETTSTTTKQQHETHGVTQQKETKHIDPPIKKEALPSKEQPHPIQEGDKQKKANLTQSHPKMNINTISSNNPKEEITKLLEEIYREIKSIDTNREVFKTIHTIFNNITTNPHEQKYKKISIEKISLKWPYQSILNFLKYCGFKSIDNQYMILMDQSNKSFSILPEINAFIISKKLAESQFNPYQSSFNSLTNDSGKVKEISNETNFEEMIKAELNRRDTMITNAIISRDPKCYQLTTSFTMNNVIVQMNQKASEDEVNEEDKKILKRQIELIKSKENDRFTLKSRNSFEILIKTPIYLKSDIRLVFPDNYIIEVSFGLKETIGDIYSFIRQYLANPEDQFTISTTPPPKKYNQLHQSIKELKLYPKVLMYVNFESTYNKLKEEEILKIKAKIEE